jgi:hypothetical protein
LVLTPDGFALWLNTTIYACFAGIKRKFRPSKKPNLGFFAEGLSQMTQPLYIFPGFRRNVRNFGVKIWYDKLPLTTEYQKKEGNRHATFGTMEPPKRFASLCSSAPSLHLFSPSLLVQLRKRRREDGQHRHNPSHRG